MRHEYMQDILNGQFKLVQNRHVIIWSDYDSIHYLVMDNSSRENESARNHSLSGRRFTVWISVFGLSNSTLLKKFVSSRKYKKL